MNDLNGRGAMEYSMCPRRAHVSHPCGDDVRFPEICARTLEYDGP